MDLLLELDQVVELVVIPFGITMVQVPGPVLVLVPMELLLQPSVS